MGIRAAFDGQDVLSGNGRMGVCSEMSETSRNEYSIVKPYDKKQEQLSIAKPYDRKQEQLSIAKPYNRKQEQLSIVKYYDRMRELGCFSLQDVADMVGERSAVAYLVNDYQRRGYIDRIHRNLYTVMDNNFSESQ